MAKPTRVNLKLVLDSNKSYLFAQDTNELLYTFDGLVPLPWDRLSELKASLKTIRDAGFTNARFEWLGGQDTTRHYSYHKLSYQTATVAKLCKAKPTSIQLSIF